jgi:hypothetical protein
MERSAAPLIAGARRAADPEGLPASAYGDLRVAAATRGHLVALTVTYGPVTRLAVFRMPAAKRLAVPASASWMTPWAARPIVTDVRTVALLCDSVQDAGMRSAMRLEVFSVGGAGLRRTFTTQLARLLDWGGFRVAGDRVMVTGIEPPRSFMTTSPERLFTVSRIYRLADGTARMVSERLGQPEVRCVDRWLHGAHAARRPDAMQARVRTDFPELGVIESWRVSGVGDRRTVELVFPEGMARFTVSRSRGGLRVVDYAKQR